MIIKLLSQLGAAVHFPLLPVQRGLRMMLEGQNRERIRLASEMAQTKGLMPLLMKQRNGYRWTTEDRRVIREDMAALVHMCPYLLLFVLPGGFFVMPILAWWLDRRRLRRRDKTGKPGAPLVG